MHSDQYYYPRKPLLPIPDHLGSYYVDNVPLPSMFGGTIPPSGVKPSWPSFQGIDFQPSETCPRNFIIFDQTNNRSQVMFHPEIGSKLLYHRFWPNVSQAQENFDRKVANDVREVTSVKEDSDDIDALLSTEYEENEECDEDVLSTARTQPDYGSSSPDSCSNYEYKSRKRSSCKRPSSSRCSFGDKRHQKMRKMVKALKGIVPGTTRMSTVAVLDEAVRYLKSLRVEVQKLGVGNLKTVGP